MIFLLNTGIQNNVVGESIQTVNISNNPGVSDKPQIFADDKTLHMIWTDNFEGNFEIYYSNSNDRLEPSKIVNLSNNQGTSAFPRLFIENNTVYATWYDYSPGQSDVYFAKSSDGGKTFSLQNLSNDIKASYNPWIGGISNNVYVVWNDGGKSEQVDVFGEKRYMDILFGDMEIFFAHSDDFGETFEIKNISQTDGDSIDARIRVDGNRVYAVWTQSTNSGSEIYFAQSENYGLNFSTPLNISKSLKLAHHAGITLLDNNIYTIWKQDYQNQTEIFFSKSNDHGKTFSLPTKISGETEKTEISRDAQMKAVNDRVYVVFSAEINKNRETFVTISPDKGESFEEPINLSKNLGRSSSPQVYLEDDNLFIIWSDDSSGNFDILSRYSFDGGRSFGPIKNITNDTSDSVLSVMGPQIASMDNNLFVFWENKSKTDDLFLTKIPKDDSKYFIEMNNKKIDINLQIVENDLIVPVNINFHSDTKEDIVFMILINDKNGTQIVKTTELAYGGSFSGNLDFPKKGEYRLAIESDDQSTGSKQEKQDVIVMVVPEFHSALLPLLVISVSLIIITKHQSRFSCFRGT